MPAGRNNWITGTVRSFVHNFAKGNDKFPSVGDVMDSHPELLNHRSAVLKALQRVKEKTSQAQPPAPGSAPPRALPAAEGVDPAFLQTRLDNTRKLIEVLEERGLTGNVDAHALDKLVRLEWDIIKRIRCEIREAEADKAASAINPTWAAMVKTANERAQRGSTARTEKHEVEISDSGQAEATLRNAS